MIQLVFPILFFFTLPLLGDGYHSLPSTISYGTSSYIFQCEVHFEAFAAPLDKQDLGWDGTGPRRRNQYVNSTEDLKLHFVLHIARVQRLMLALKAKHPEEYGAVTQDQIIEFSRHHDRTKIQSSGPFVRRYWGDTLPPDGPDMLQRLLPMYNVDWNTAPKELQDYRNDTVGRLNHVDDQVEMETLRQMGLVNRDGSLTEVGKQLKYMARVADVVDRNTETVAREELGSRGSAKMEEFIKDAKILALAKELQLEWATITIGLQYTDYVNGVVKQVSATALAAQLLGPRSPSPR